MYLAQIYNTATRVRIEPDLPLRSPTLYHKATAPPSLNKEANSCFKDTLAVLIVMVEPEMRTKKDISKIYSCSD